MANSTLTEEDLYRFGRYAFRRRGYRPVVSLPGSHAQRLIEIKQYGEILGIGLFLLSSALFFMNAVGSAIPTIIGAVVIVFRATVIVLGHSIIARTVVREVSVPAESAPEGGQIKGRERSYESTSGLDVRAQVKGSELHLVFQNYKHRRVNLEINVQSKSGAIVAVPHMRQIIVPPSKMGSIRESELIFNLDAIEGGINQGDTLDVRVNAAPMAFAEEEEYRTVGEFEIPVTISGTNEMSSEVVTTEYDIEILDQ